MIRPMRRWLVVLLVLLLPLRALVGEAMAGQMLQQGAALLATVDADAGAEAHAASHGCDHHPGHAAQAASDDEEPQATAPDAMTGDCPTCASCQVCSSVALSPSVQAPAAERASQAPPLTVQRPYPSAEPVLAFKPPRA